MNTLQIPKGSYLHKIGDNADSLDVILSGKIELHGDGFGVTLKRGTVIGLLEHAQSAYTYDYIATEDTTLLIYPYTRKSDVNQIVSDQFSNCDVLITANAGQVVSIAAKYRHYKKYSDKFCQCVEEAYNTYKDLCTLYKYDIQSYPFIEDLEKFVPEKDIPDWLGDYYDQLEIMPKESKMAFFGSHTSISTAALIEAADYAGLFLRMCTQVCNYTTELVNRFFNSSSGDIFDLYTNLAEKAKKNNDTSGILDDIKDNIDLLFAKIGTNPLIQKDKLNQRINQISDIQEGSAEKPEETPQNTYEKIEHSLDTILKFTQLDEAEEERFRGLIKQFRALKDKNSTEDDARRLRNDIAKSFFDIYETAIISSIECKNIPTILKMFFFFGYIDENLIGKDNALILYDMAEKINYDGRNNVYTIYEWLVSIYNGINEPSKNEFDQDFPTFLKSQRQGGYISEEMESRYLSSPKEKLRFEIMNLFKSGMKIACGRPSTFCPLLSEHNVIKPLESILATAEKINQNWNIIRSIDYSCFFREAAFQAPEFHISRDTILQEVLPYVILMPTIGGRSGIWQETSGVRRDTPARMYIPIFATEDLFQMQLKLAGEFRWEICKKIQGARWNDVTEHSLTSEYFDYLQFYRKNNELSPEAKEKIKTSLTNNKNSFRSVFVADYMIWIKFESQGSPRLNKISKAIMFSYCPFSKTVRDKLKVNPMYGDMIARHEGKALKRGKLLGAHYDKMKNDKGELPEEIIKYVNYFSM